MKFREFNQKYLEPGTIWLMVLGIIFLCQPWVGFLHAWSVLVMLVGIIGFNVAAHVPPPDEAAAEEEVAPVAAGGNTHG